jgi:hypothetical protein
MPQPPSLDSRFETFVQALPADYAEQAYEFKAFTRARKIKSPLQLLQLVMLYCAPDFSLRSCAGEVARFQGYLSDTAVKKRLSACVPWVKSLLKGVFNLSDVIDSGALRFIVIDGSTVQEPGATGTTYRLHIAVDLINLSVREIGVTTDKVGESLDHYTLESGDVVLLDRGYNSPKSLVPFIDRGGEVVLRYNAHSMNLFEEDDTGRLIKIDWEARLKKLNQQAGYVEASLCHGNKRIPVYVHAMPLPPAQAAEARRKAKQRSKKKTSRTTVKTLYLSGWVLVLTSVPPALFSTETAAALYRVRWQVELVIKRMKSLLLIDELRAHKGTQLAELYLQGKLLYVAVTQKLAQSRFPCAARSMDKPRQLTDWRLWKSVSADVLAGIKACFPRKERFAADCILSLSERPRKRHLQHLPAAVLDIMDTCRRLGVSHV